MTRRHPISYYILFSLLTAFDLIDPQNPEDSKRTQRRAEATPRYLPFHSKLALPNLDSFPFLTQFLYLKDAHTLLEAFLSLMLPKGIPSDLDQPTRYNTFVAEYSTIFAQNYMMQQLASQAARVQGLWRNVCALGISNVDLRPSSISHGRYS
jgi:hypothetical protein